MGDNEEKAGEMFAKFLSLAICLIQMPALPVNVFVFLFWHIAQSSAAFV